jgi:Tfp pilus assembly protein PilF
LLRATHPHLPRHANVVLVNMPHLLLYAYGGDKGLQDWTGDSTLHLFSFDVFQRNLTMPVACVLQYQPWQTPELIEIAPAASRMQEVGYALLQQEQFDRALATLARADSLEPDPRAVVFHANSAGLRAFAFETSMRFDEAKREARRAIAIDGHNRNARLVLAAEAIRAGELDEADGQLDSLLADDPRDAKGLQLREAVAAARLAHLPSPPLSPLPR